MPIKLLNPFWEIVLESARPQLAALGFDAHGGSRWCANFLKTGAPCSSHLPLTGPTGGQSGYVDAAGDWWLSSSSTPAKFGAISETEAVLDDIDYGDVVEQWRLRLDGPKLEWTIRQTWRRETVVADAFAPGLFFAAQALWGEATLKGGVIEQGNFHNYRILRMHETPSIEAYMVPSTESPTGIGEPPTAISMPALANAVFAATGVRVRKLPIARADLAIGASARDQVVI